MKVAHFSILFLTSKIVAPTILKLATANFLSASYFCVYGLSTHTPLGQQLI
jgi:hypothetical protein